MRTSTVDPRNLPMFVNRRHREARECVRKGKHLLRSQADPVTRELLAILKARSGDHRHKREQAHASLDENLVRALDIHESDHSLVRAKLQALLLTNLSFEEIGKRMSETTRVVELYAMCFFDVRQEMPIQLRNEVIAALSDLLLAEQDFRALRRRGTVCSEQRRGTTYFKLRFRTEDGRQRVRYLGNDPGVAETIRRELQDLQLNRQHLVNLKRRDREARRLLRQIKQSLACAIEGVGFHYHGFAIRKKQPS
jgi:hypothetical protein